MECSDTLKVLSEIISYTLSAPIYATVLAWYMLWVMARFSITEWVSAFVFLGAVPTVAVLAGVAKGKVDVFVSKRSDRPVYFVPAVASHVVGGWVFTMFGDWLLAVFAFTYAVVTASILIVTFVEKVSVHAAGVAGPTTFMVLAFGAAYSVLYVLVPTVGFARLCLKAHTTKELVLGTLIAVIVTVLTWFALMGTH